MSASGVFPADDAAVLVFDVIKHDAGTADDVGQPRARIVIEEVLLALLPIARRASHYPVRRSRSTLVLPTGTPVML